MVAAAALPVTATRGTAAWAKSVGIDLAGKKTWKVEVTLYDSGKLPGPVLPSIKATYFYLQIENDIWGVDVGIGGKRYHYSQLGAGKASASETALKVPKGLTLAKVGAWLAKLEKLHGVAFRRDRAFVQSTVKGGKRAVEMWLATI